MLHRPLRGLLTLAVIGTTLLLQRPVVAEEKILSDQLLSPNVLAYVTIPSVPEFKARWENSLYGELRRDEDLAEFWKDIEVQWRKLSTETEKQIGIKLDELLAIPSGELTFAVLKDPGRKPAVVGFLDYGTNEATVDQLLSKAAEALQEQGAERSVKRTDEATIIVYKIKPKQAVNDDEDADDDTPREEPEPETIAYFVSDSNLVFSNTVESLESVLARWDGKHPQTFAGNETYNYIRERCQSDHDAPMMTWYIDPMGAVRAAVSSAGQGNMQAQMVMGFLPALGVTKLKAIGGTFDMGTEKYASVSRTMMYVDLPTSGLLKIFEFPAKTQTPPAWVGADVSSYMAFNWGLSGAFDAVRNLVDMFQGPGAFDKVMDRVADQENGPKIHPQKDVVDQLTGEIHVVTAPPTDEETPVERYTVALGLKDAEKMQTLLARIAGTDGYPGKSRQFRDQTIYEIDAPQGNMKLGYAVSGNSLFFVSDVVLLEDLLRKDQDRQLLRDNAAYRRMAEHFPEQTSIIGYQRQDTQMKTAYELLRKGQAGDVVEGIDFTKLPPFEAVQKYLPPTGNYARPDKNGAFFESFSLPTK